MFKKNIMPKKVIPLEINGINDNIYSGFLSRLAANLLDLLITFPILYISILIFLSINNKYIYLIYYSIITLFQLWYNIYLPKRYGGTVGKIIVGLKIIRMDSFEIGWKEAILRHGVNIIFIIINSVGIITAVLSADDEIYNNLRSYQRPVYIGSFIIGKTIISTIGNIWVWSEIIILLTNKRKRALHDFIAGTVIVKTKYLENIKEVFK